MLAGCQRVGCCWNSGARLGGTGHGHAGCVGWFGWFGWFGVGGAGCGGQPGIEGKPGMVGHTDGAVGWPFAH